MVFEIENSYFSYRHYGNIINLLLEIEDDEHGIDEFLAHTPEFQINLKSASIDVCMYFNRYEERRQIRLVKI